MIVFKTICLTEWTRSVEKNGRGISHSKYLVSKLALYKQYTANNKGMDDWFL